MDIIVYPLLNLPSLLFHAAISHRLMHDVSTCCCVIVERNGLMTTDLSGYIVLFPIVGDLSVDLLFE